MPKLVAQIRRSYWRSLLCLTAFKAHSRGIPPTHKKYCATRRSTMCIALPSGEPLRRDPWFPEWSAEMNTRRIIARVGYVTSVVILFLSAGTLLLWPLAEKVLPVNDPAQLFGVSIAVLAALLLELMKRVVSNQ